MVDTCLKCHMEVRENTPGLADGGGGSPFYEVCAHQLTLGWCTVEINSWIGAAFAVMQMLYCFVAQRELADLLVDQGPQIMPSRVGYYCSLLEERSASGEQTQGSSLPFLTYSLF